MKFNKKIFIKFSILLFLCFHMSLGSENFLKGIKFGIGVQQNFITSYYNEYDGKVDYIQAQQAYHIKYEGVNLLHLNISWKDIIGYEKTFPLNNSSKQVFSLWKKSYYERDMFFVNLFLSYFLKEKNKDIDIFAGYNFDKEVYNSKLTINDKVLKKGYDVYYVVAENGNIKSLEKLSNAKKYSLLQDFSFENKYIGFKIFFLKFWGGSCKISSNQPITWWYDNLFQKKSAVIIRSHIKSSGKCVGIGFSRKFGEEVYIYMPKIVELGPLFGKTKWTVLKEAGLTPDYIFKIEPGRAIYLSNETHIGVKLKNFNIDISYNPYIFSVQGKDPFFHDYENVFSNIIHRFILSITYEY